MVRRRTLKQVDDDLRQVRARILDSTRFSERWVTGWAYIDKLLDERLRLRNPPEENAILEPEALCLT